MNKNVIWFENLRMTDVGEVGGKNASLGEMISQLSNKNIRVPGGFATTADAYKRFLEDNNLKQKIDDVLATLDVDNVIELAKAGKMIQAWIMDAPFPKDFEVDLEAAYTEMLGRYEGD
ncbi:MAG: PEP/pyruvate-binding domain-containing protein, partial [Burkholderiales bacterium]|nr:PEP/pyruvate-binding domain-containing protein [Burkholderiales bacterium]